MDVEKYLRRIAYDGPREVSAETLRGLHRQHLFSVPFENLDIPLGIPIHLDLDSIYRKIVERRRGGYCYELNGLFGALLSAMGFRVQMLSARVRRENGGFGPEFDHMLLKVELDETWLVDVGFGDSFVNPIIFQDGAADRVNGYRYLIAAENGEWRLVREDGQGRVPLYAFRDHPHSLNDYQEMSDFQQTSPESHFTKSWICSRATPHGRITVANMRLIVTNNGDRDEMFLATEDELRHCLRESFGVELGPLSLLKLVEASLKSSASPQARTE